MSCLVPILYDAENDVCLNCPVAVHVINGAPEQTIDRKSEEMKICGSDNVDEWSDDGVQVSGCDDNVA